MLTAITVCVDFDDLLEWTLPINAAQVDRFIVVSTLEDEKTAAVVAEARRELVHVELLTTNVFYAQEADFNKGAAIEEAFEYAGRDGWFMLLDVDTLLPTNDPGHGQFAFKERCWPTIKKGPTDVLYGPSRRIVADLDDCMSNDAEARMDRRYELLDQHAWWQYPIHQERGFPGYCQIFHASALKSKPWYPTDWRHAGGSDSEFEQKWPADKKVKVGWSVLHLGAVGQGWHGRLLGRWDGQEVPDFAKHLVKQQELWRQRQKTRRRGGNPEERL